MGREKLHDPFVLSDIVIRRDVEVDPSLGRDLRPVARGKDPVRAFVDLTVIMERRVKRGAKANATPDHARRVMVGIIPYRRHAMPQSCLRWALIYNSAFAYKVGLPSCSSGFRRI